MTIAEMHIAIKLGVDKNDTLSTPNLEPEERDFWLNKGIERFVKQRYGINNLKRDAFERTEKRINDLRTVIQYAQIPPEDYTSSNNPSGRFYSLPSASPTNMFWFAIKEEVECYIRSCNSVAVTENELVLNSDYLVVNGSIIYDDITYNANSGFTASTNTFYTNDSGTATVVTATKTRLEVHPTTHDEYVKKIKDPFNKPSTDTVLRLARGNYFELLFRQGVGPGTLFLSYIKKPIIVSLQTNTSCSLPDHTHSEIIDLTVSMILEGLESPRYGSNLADLRTQE